MRLFLVSRWRPYICPCCHQPSRWVNSRAGMLGGIGGGITGGLAGLLIRFFGFSIGIPLVVLLAFALPFFLLWIFGKLAPIPKDAT